MGVNANLILPDRGLLNLLSSTIDHNLKKYSTVKMRIEKSSNAVRYVPYSVWIDFTVSTISATIFRRIRMIMKRSKYFSP